MPSCATAAGSASRIRQNRSAGAQAASSTTCSPASASSVAIVRSSSSASALHAGRDLDERIARGSVGFERNARRRIRVRDAADGRGRHEFECRQHLAECTLEREQAGERRVVRRERDERGARRSFYRRKRERHGRHGVRAVRADEALRDVEARVALAQRSERVDHGARASASTTSTPSTLRRTSPFDQAAAARVRADEAAAGIAAEVDRQAEAGFGRHAVDVGQPHAGLDRDAAIRRVERAHRTHPVERHHALRTAAIGHGGADGPVRAPCAINAMRCATATRASALVSAVEPYRATPSAMPPWSVTSVTYDEHSSEDAPSSQPSPSVAASACCAARSAALIVSRPARAACAAGRARRPARSAARRRPGCGASRSTPRARRR